MKQDSGNSRSTWHDSIRTVPASHKLPDTTDVCIVGAGIAGLSCAYMLGKEGRQVLVLDDGPVGGGETGRTTAHLASIIDDRFVEIERMHGTEGSRLAYESHAAAIDRIEQLIAEEGIDCDFQRLDAFLFQAASSSPTFLEDELEAARRAGVADAEMTTISFGNNGSTCNAIRFPRQAQFDPMKYLNGLARSVKSMGGTLVTDAHVMELNPQEPGKIIVKLEDGRTVTAKSAIVATNSPITSFTIHVKQAPYRTYAIAIRAESDSIPTALYWDTEDPYHYVRLQETLRDGKQVRLLIVGGEDHKTGLEHDYDARFARLENWARDRFPGLENVEYRWSGQVMEPADGVAFIGRTPGGEPDMYLVTGDSGMGLTHATLGAMLIADLVTQRDNPWEKLYDPRRKTLKSMACLVRENLDSIPQLMKHVTPGEVKSEEEIGVGEGAILRRGTKKIAVYRDENGKLHERSAVCTHLGCVLEWNSLEKSWDCPCHGSRFNVAGKVLNGPTEIPLPIA